MTATLSETRESIKRRIQQEAGRQWGIDENDLRNGSFDPLVDLLFGVFSVELEKLRNEIESSRNLVVSRLAETILPEVLTGIIPAHTVMCAPPVEGEAVANRTDTFAAPGRENLCFTPAGNFDLSGARVEVIATGSRIDKPAKTFQREPLLQIPSGKWLPPGTCWLGVKVPRSSAPADLPLFFHWPEQPGSLNWNAYIPSAIIETAADGRPGERVATSTGITSEHDQRKDDLTGQLEYTAREVYQPDFLTLHLGRLASPQQSRYPAEWQKLLEPGQLAVFNQDLLWLKLTMPPAITAPALESLSVLANCFPAIARQLVHQRGKLQPLFNVYGLQDTRGFLAIEKVLNGDGDELLPVDKIEGYGSANTYSLRNRNVARFDKRDAFQLLTELSSRMREELSAFEAIDSAALSSHLESIQKSVKKISEHLQAYPQELPGIYLTAKTASKGSVIDISYWSSTGSGGNGLPAFSKLNPADRNSYKAESAVTLFTSSGGRDSSNEEERLKLLREAMLTRGRAVTKEDFRVIARNALSATGADVVIAKKTDVSEKPKEGARQILEVMIIPDESRGLPEVYWVSAGTQLKKKLEQRSAGLMPLYVKVQGYGWRV